MRIANISKHRRYVVLGGRDVTELGFEPLSVPQYIVPQKRTSAVKIPGRSGVLHLWGGEYETVTYRLKLYFEGETIDQQAYKLNQATTLQMSSIPGFVFDCVTEVVKIERSKAGWYTVEVECECNPERYRVDQPIYRALDFDLYAQGNTWAKPIISLFPASPGSNISIRISGGGGSRDVQIRSVNSSLELSYGQCLVDGVPAQTKMAGDYFRLEALDGEGKPIRYHVNISGASQVEFRPEWRWV